MVEPSIFFDFMFAFNFDTIADKMSKSTHNACKRERILNNKRWNRTRCLKILTFSGGCCLLFCY